MPNLAPLKWYQKLGLAIFAVPVLLFLVLPALVVLVIFWLKTLAMMNRQMKNQMNADRGEPRASSRSSGPIEPEVIVPNQFKLPPNSQRFQ